MSETGKKFRQILSLGNSRTEILLVMLEPWGEDFWLLQHEKFHIKVESKSDDFWYHVENTENAISVYVDGDFEHAAVMQNDEVLECGHNRPDDAWQ